MIVIESLQTGKHERNAFSCGREPLDRFLREHAHQAAAKGLSKTYVAIDEDDEAAILGYYTVTTSRLDAGELPPPMLRTLKLPKGDLPASLVARLAVSEIVTGRGIGSLMLMDAMARCARVSEQIGGVAIIVDALDESVVAFYERVGFVRIRPGSLQLFIPMVTVRRLLGIDAPALQPT